MWGKKFLEDSWIYSWARSLQKSHLEPEVQETPRTSKAGMGERFGDCRKGDLKGRVVLRQEENSNVIVTGW